MPGGLAVLPECGRRRLRRPFQILEARVTTDQFRYDRDACIGKATRTHWGSLGTWQWVDHSRSAKRFFACMKAMGYQPDPAGKFETSMPLWT